MCWFVFVYYYVLRCESRLQQKNKKTTTSFHVWAHTVCGCPDVPFSHYSSCPTMYFVSSCLHHINLSFLPRVLLDHLVLQGLLEEWVLLELQLVVLYKISTYETFTPICPPAAPTWLLCVCCLIIWMWVQLSQSIQLSNVALYFQSKSIATWKLHNQLGIVYWPY